jgi:hypothetical protein
MVVLSGRSSRSTDPREAHLPTSFGLKFTHHPVNVFYLSQRWTLSRRRNTLANCELKRLVIVNKNFRCLSRVYVRISRFPKIIRMEISLIRGNLKAPLAEEFNAPTHSLDQFILPCIFADEVCSQARQCGHGGQHDRSGHRPGGHHVPVPLGAGRGMLSGSVRHLSLSKTRFGCIDGSPPRIGYATNISELFDWPSARRVLPERNCVRDPL